MPEAQEKGGPGLLIGLLNAKKPGGKDDEFKVHTTGDNPKVTAAEGILDAVKSGSPEDLAEALQTFLDVGTD